MTRKLVIMALLILGGGLLFFKKHNTIPKEVPSGMVWLKGGTFRQGCGDCAMDDAQPVHQVTVDGFWMDETPVTNRAFEAFAKASAHLTVAERPLDEKDFPGVPKEKLVPGSAIFTPPTGPVPLDNELQWWSYKPGASWHDPQGSGVSAETLADHPVVQVAFEDAVNYCRWLKKRLPTEAEFEYAARGGLEGKKYSWGDELTPDGRWMANIYQGHFPDKNEGLDGFVGTSPVKAFPPNGFGLYDMSGNVWQWVSDWYRSDYYSTLGEVTHNPKGPDESSDTREPGVQKRVQKGGSFLCSSQFCTRYLVGSRGKAEPTSASSNLGFRCARAADPD